jgi:hypothetical protein
MQIRNCKIQKHLAYITQWKLGGMVALFWAGPSTSSDPGPRSPERLRSAWGAHSGTSRRPVAVPTANNYYKDVSGHTAHGGSNVSRVAAQTAHSSDLGSGGGILHQPCGEQSGAPFPTA